MARFRYVLDTNIVIDFVEKRAPFYEASRLLMLLGRIGEFELWLLESQFTDLIYILTEGGNSSRMQQTLQALRGLRSFIEVYSNGAEGIDRMLNTDRDDPEDALIHEAALALQADAIITRNQDDFGGSLVKAMDCEQLFAYLEDTHDLVYALEEDLR